MLLANDAEFDSLTDVDSLTNRFDVDTELLVDVDVLLANDSEFDSLLATDAEFDSLTDVDALVEVDSLAN